MDDEKLMWKNLSKLSQDGKDALSSEYHKHICQYERNYRHIDSLYEHLVDRIFLLRQKVQKLEAKSFQGKHRTNDPVL